MNRNVPEGLPQVSPIDVRVARRLILDTAYHAGVGHLGSALSVVEILAALFGEVLRVADPADPDRDRFILSKGHAALALYTMLVLRGVLPRDALATYCRDGGLGVHPGCRTRGIDFATGSLGHGLSYGAGAALAARWDGSPRRAFVLLSDAELNEGSTWEAAMFAAHHELHALTAIVDANGQQAFGHTAAVMNLEPLAARFDAFGWAVSEVDGHDRFALVKALDLGTRPQRQPRAVIARTVSGRGVSFMERRIEWHYLPMNAEQYRQAIAEIDAAG